MFTSLAATAPAVLAPELARDLGVAPQWIGVFVGLVYMGAMLASLASAGFIERFGAIRVSQVCVLMCAVGIAMVGSLPASADRPAGCRSRADRPRLWPDHPRVLAGPGPDHAAGTDGADVLDQADRRARRRRAGRRRASRRRRSRWDGGRRWCWWASLGLGVIVARRIHAQALDTEHAPGKAFSMQVIIERLKLVAKSPPLAELALLSFGYAAVQVCLTSFLVVFLHDGARMVARGVRVSAYYRHGRRCHWPYLLGRGRRPASSHRAGL